MEYEESERSGYQKREGEEFFEEVHIRQEDRGVMMYAVFDGEDQVSPEFAPLEDNYALIYARAYSEGLKNGLEDDN